MARCHLELVIQNLRTTKREPTTCIHVLVIFNQTLLLLTVADCGFLKPPRNGDVELTGTSIGSIASYDCFDGYRLDGDEIRTCVDGGVWTGVDPVCNRKLLYVRVIFIGTTYKTPMYLITPGMRTPHFSGYFNLANWCPE